MENIIEEEFVDSVEIMAEEEIIGEGENAKKRMCFKGIFSEADKLNGNKRVYSRKVLKEAFDEAIARSSKSGQPIFGELEHAKDAHINLERIAVTFPEFSWNEETGQITGKAVPTLTEAGKVVEGLAKSGFKICFSTRMSGKLAPMSDTRKAELGIMEDCKEVIGPCRIISIDVVGTPSCQKAVTDTVYEEETLKEEQDNSKTFREVFDSVF